MMLLQGRLEDTLPWLTKHSLQGLGQLGGRQAWPSMKAIESWTASARDFSFCLLLLLLSPCSGCLCSCSFNMEASAAVFIEADSLVYEVVAELWMTFSVS